MGTTGIMLCPRKSGRAQILPVRGPSTTWAKLSPERVAPAPKPQPRAAPILGDSGGQFPVSLPASRPQPALRGRIAVARLVHVRQEYYQRGWRIRPVSRYQRNRAARPGRLEGGLG